MVLFIKIVLVALLVAILFVQYCFLLVASDNEEDERRLERKDKEDVQNKD